MTALVTAGCTDKLRRHEKRLEFGPHTTGETGQDGEKRSTAFSKTAGINIDDICEWMSLITGMDLRKRTDEC